MLTAIQSKIATLTTELKSNQGIVPAAWKPYMDLIVILLKVVRAFMPVNVQSDIDVIVSAIQAAENI